MRVFAAIVLSVAFAGPGSWVDRSAIPWSGGAIYAEERDDAPDVSDELDEESNDETPEDDPDRPARDSEPPIEPVRSPDIFVPSEDISEDLEVTFPVDI